MIRLCCQKIDCDDLLPVLISWALAKFLVMLQKIARAKFLSRILAVFVLQWYGQYAPCVLHTLIKRTSSNFCKRGTGMNQEFLASSTLFNFQNFVHWRQPNIPQNIFGSKLSKFAHAIYHSHIKPMC